MFFRRNYTPVSWIAVFLGNPGLKYENTRHNAGFITADIIAKELAIKINRIKFNALTAIVKLGGKQILMLKPQTYMNLSGNPVKQAMRYYKLPLENVVVISDDVSLPAGKLRVRRRGSAGGHNGLKDIIAKCGGEEFSKCSNDSDIEWGMKMTSCQKETKCTETTGNWKIQSFGGIPRLMKGQETQAGPWVVDVSQSL